MSISTRVGGVSLLFCDLVGSTALTMEIGEAASDELRRDLFESLRRPITVFGGREVKSQGDGLMVAFRRSARSAIECAVAMQRAVDRLDAAPGPSLSIRIGLSTGEVTKEEDDWFGTPVIEAARLCALAGAGEIVATDQMVRAAGWSDDGVVMLGPTSLKGFAEPVPCSRIDWPRPLGAPHLAPLPPPLQLDGHPSFVGDRSSLDQALDDWRTVTQGGCATTLVCGEPRTGRTRWAAEFARLVLDTCPAAAVLYGVPDRAADTTALATALRRFVLWSPAPMADRLMAVPGFERSVPAARTRAGARREPLADDRHTGASGTLLEALRVLGEQAPTLVVLDDLDTGDDATTDELNAVITSAIPGVHVVASYRTSAERDDGLERTLTAVDAVTVARPIVLSGLGGPECRALVAQSGRCDGDLADAITATVGSAAGDVVAALAIVRDLDVPAAQVRGVLASAFPYRGLLPLDVDDRAVFFGRDDVVDAVARRLDAHGFVAVVGASGSGKSSLLRAGVAGRSEVPVAVLTPDVTDFEASFNTCARRGDGIVIDQFEQIFVRFDATETARLLDLIADASVFGRPTWIAIALRSDFYGRCADHAAFARMISESTVLVGRPDDADLRAIVRDTAEAAQLDVAPGFAELLINDLRHDVAPLPLLAHAMFETWRRRRDHRLTVDDYRGIGGVRGAIARTAAGVYALQPDDDARRLLDAVLLRMVAIVDDLPPARQSCELITLTESFGPRVDAVVERLVSARLVVVDGGSVELAHEALLSEWPRLADLIDADREQLRVMAHLTRSAREWNEDGRPDTSLYRGARLDAALALSAGAPLSDLERAYIEEGRRHRDHDAVALRRTNARLRRRLVVMTVSMTLALVGIVVAVTQLRSADRARAVADEGRRTAQLDVLASTALDLADTDVAAAGLLAVEANRLRPGALSAGTIGTVLRSQPALLRWRSTPLLDDLELVDVSEDRAIGIFSGPNGWVTMDISTMTSFPPSGVTGAAAALNADGTTSIVVDGTSWSTVTVRTGTVIASGVLPTEFGDHAVDEVRWLSGSSVVLTRGELSDVWSLDVGTGAAHLLVPTAAGPAFAVDRNPDRVAVAPADSRFGQTVQIVDATSGEVITGVDLDPATVKVSSLALAGDVLLVTSNLGLEVIDLDDTTRQLVGVPVVDADALLSVDARAATAVTIGPSGRTQIHALGAAGEVVTTTGGVMVGATGVIVGDDQHAVVTADGWSVDLSTAGAGPLVSAPIGTADDLPLAFGSDGSLYVWRTDRVVRLGSDGRQLAYDGDAEPMLTPPSDSPLVAAEIESDGFRVAIVDPAGTVLARSGVFEFDTALVRDPSRGRFLLQEPGSYEVVELREPGLGTANTGYDLPPVREPKLTMSHDGTMLARLGRTSADDVRLDVVLTDGGTPVLTHVFDAAQPAITNADFAPDDRSMLVSDTTGTTFRFDIDTGVVTRTGFPSSGTGYPWLAHRSTDGLVAAVDDGGRLSLWDPATESSIWEPIQAVVDPAGGALITSTPDFTVWAMSDGSGIQVWNLDLTTWSSIACERAGRNLSVAEWDRYMPDGEPYHQTCQQFPVGG